MIVFAACCARSGGREPAAISSAKPRMLVSGVFISCVTLAMNSFLERAAAIDSVTSVMRSTQMLSLKVKRSEKSRPSRSR